MDLREEKVGGVTVVLVQGRIDSTTAPALGEQLTAKLGAPKARVLLDLSQIAYISSAGFKVLLLAAKRAEEAGSGFVLCGVSGKVRLLLDVGGFLDLFVVLWLVVAG